MMHNTSKCLLDIMVQLKRGFNSGLNITQYDSKAVLRKQCKKNWMHFVLLVFYHNVLLIKLSIRNYKKYRFYNY